MPRLIEVPDIGNVEFPDDMTDDSIGTAIKSMYAEKGKADSRKKLESTLSGPSKPNPLDVIRDPGAKELGLSRDMENRTWDAASAEKNTDKSASKGILQMLAGLVGGGLAGSATSGMAPGLLKGALEGAGNVAGTKVGEGLTGDKSKLSAWDTAGPIGGALGGLFSKAVTKNSVGRSQALVDALQGKEGTVAGTVAESKTPSTAMDSLQQFFKDKVGKYLPADKTKAIDATNTAVSEAKVDKAKLAEDIFAAAPDDKAPLIANKLNLDTGIAKQQDLKLLLQQQQNGPGSWPKKITDIPQGKVIAEQIANTPITSEEFTQALYDGGPRVAKVAMAMVANHPNSAALTTQIRQGYTQKLLRETFDATSNKFVGKALREKLLNNPEAKATLSELYPGNKNVSAALDDIAEICRGGALDSMKNAKAAFVATAKGLVTAGTMAHFGHAGPAIAVASGAGIAGGSLLPWGKAVDALMRNDALRKSALALAKSGNIEQGSAAAGQLFRTFLKDNAEPVKSKTP